jgi:hypothetical protein
MFFFAKKIKFQKSSLSKCDLLYPHNKKFPKIKISRQGFDVFRSKNHFLRFFLEKKIFPRAQLSKNSFPIIFFGLFSYQSMVLQLASEKKLEKNARCVIRKSDLIYLIIMCKKYT